MHFPIEICHSEVNFMLYSNPDLNIFVKNNCDGCPHAPEDSKVPEAIASGWTQNFCSGVQYFSYL